MLARAPVDPRKLLTGLGLAVGVGGLVLQTWLAIPAYLADGKDIFGALGTLLAFYTILTNIVLVLIYLSGVFDARWLDLFRKPVVRGAMAANISLVLLYVYFVLRHLSVLEGQWVLADNLLHYVAPLLYILWWLSAQAHGLLVWRDLPVMLVPTFVYLLYVLARGAWVMEYPYPILAVTRLGYPAVFLNALYMTLGLAALTAIVIGLDKAVVKHWNTVHD